MLEVKNKRDLKKIASILGSDISTWSVGEFPIRSLQTEEPITFDAMAQIVEFLMTSDSKDELFEQCWIAYRRKGSKKKAKEYWRKLSEKEKPLVLPHIKAYVESREISYQKDFERYLRDKIFLTVVFKNSQIVYDPDKFDGNTYSPQGRTIWFNEGTKSYWSDDNFYYGTISDGYNDNNRPNGATLTLNNSRGNITWNATIKKWVKEKLRVVSFGNINNHGC